MPKLHRMALAALLILCVASAAHARSIRLGDGWQVQSSAEVTRAGEVVSTPAFAPQGWYAASVPSTVLAALVANGEYRDLYRGMNLESVPVSRFQRSWWYRKTFAVEPRDRHATARLLFDGINYRANVFLNGKRIAGADTTFGAFRTFDLDVSGALRDQNVLAVEVLPPQKGDYTLGFVDWNPAAPDADMGLFRPVWLRLSGAVSIEHPYVTSVVDVQTLREARLTVSATLVNHGDAEARGALVGDMEGRKLRQDYVVPPHASLDLTFPPLVIENPRLWWPADLGSPTLHTLRLAAVSDGKISDRSEQRFGIRQVGDYLNAQGHRGYTVNGRRILIKGGGWADDMLLREDPARLETQLRYVRHMHLNTIRLEGIWGSSQALYGLADRLGILVMPGWSCQWEWESFLGSPQADATCGGPSSAPDVELIAACLRDQVLWLRQHPSIFVWVVGSDKLPWPEMETADRHALASLDPSRPILASCKSWPSTVSGPTAVKMNGPYDYVPPNYWYVDTVHGGAFGFNTETGPGPQPPPLESLRAMFPETWRWPINAFWDYHCARNEFRTLERWRTAFERRYGAADNVGDFAFRAQAANYEAIRAMFEAFAVNRPVSTGVVQWMLNGAWPKLYWQLYDYYLVGGGAFYGTRKACQPISLVYDYGQHAVYVVNQSPSSLRGARVHLTMLDAHSKAVCGLDQPLKEVVAPDTSQQVCSLPTMGKDSPIHFLSLRLDDAVGRKLADNFYWLSAKPDVLDFVNTTWFVTPIKEYADFTALNTLPPATVEARWRRTPEGGEVTLHNRDDGVAFFIELRLCGRKSFRDVVPVFWDDNYVSLLPGETRTLRCAFATKEKVAVQWRGFNVRGGTL